MYNNKVVQDIVVDEALNELSTGVGNAANTDLSNLSTTGTAVLAAKADLSSPTFTGTPVAPTATAGTNTTQLATTGFVTTAVTAVLPTMPTTDGTYTLTCTVTTEGATLSWVSTTA